MNLRAFVNRIAVFFVPFLLLAAAVPASAQISVTSTTPNNAAQATVSLNVTISGSGFKKGAKAQWFVSGSTNPGGVVVNSTAFNGSNTLVANITVAADAVISGFDVVVTNADGRTGKGTELFAVFAQGSTSSSFQTCADRWAAAPKVNPTPNSCVSGTAGCLDATFAGIGYETFNFAQGTTGTTDLEDVYDVAMQADKIVALSEGQSFGDRVLRLNSDGSLDSTFGNSGKVLLPFTSLGGAFWTKVLVQPDGYIVALVGSNLARLTPEGQMDSTFGVGGTVTLSTIMAGAMRLQPDGKLLVGGNTPKMNVWGIVRLNSNGSLDNSFGNAGTVTYTPAKNLSGSVRAMTIQTVTTLTGSENRIVAGGETGGSSGYFFTIARFLPNGAVDTSFGPSGTGVMRYSFQMSNQGPSGIAVDSMNRIVMAGQSQSDTCTESIDFAVVRVTPSGLPDTSFGDLNKSTGSRTGQVLSVNFYGGGNHTRAMGLQPDDRIIVSGSVRNSANGITYAGVARLATDGTLDTSFGIGGAVALSTVGVEGMTLTADGKIVLSGSTVINNAMYSNFARLWATGF